MTLRSNIPVLPAIGDELASVRAGQSPDVTVLVLDRPFEVYRHGDADRVFSFASRARAESVARQIGGFVKKIAR